MPNVVLIPKPYLLAHNARKPVKHSDQPLDGCIPLSRK